MQESSSLDFSSKKLTDEALIALCHNTLKDCSQLQHLNLSQNNITDKGIEVFSKLFHNNQTLVTLNLTNNEITSEGIGHLSKAFENNPFIQFKLSDNPIGSPGAKILSDGLSKKVIGELRLKKNGFDDTGIAALSIPLKNHFSITTLVISKNEIGEQGAIGLQSVLQNNRYIRVMDLSGNKIGVTAAKILAMGFKANWGIEVLNLAFNPQMKAEGTNVILENLEQHPTLNKFYFMGNNAGDDGAHSIANLLIKNTILTSLNISANHLQIRGNQLISIAFKQNKNLKNFDLSSNVLGDENAILLASSLKEHTHIRELFLSNTEIGPDGLLALAQALKLHKTLMRVEVDLIASEPNKTQQAQTSLLEAIQTNKNLINIEFRCKTLSEEIKNQIDANTRNNQTFMRKNKASEFIEIIIILMRGMETANLPPESMYKIIQFLCLSFSEMPEFGKSYQQLHTCTKFIFDNSEEINRKIAQKEAIKIVDKISETGGFVFSFSNRV